MFYSNSLEFIDFISIYTCIADKINSKRPDTYDDKSTINTFRITAIF